jgi:hypothetical protein
MSDFENDFENLDEQEVVEEAAVEAEAAPAEFTPEPAGPVEDDFFTESAVPETAAMDPAKVVTLRTSASNRDTYVEVGEESLPLVDIVGKSGIRFNGEYQGWLNGAQISLGDKVAPGSTVSLIGSVKGG